MSKSILKRIVYPIVYTVLSLGIVIAACFTFNSVYFESVFVDGSSMEPTLKGTEGVEGGANFGFTDNSSVTKKHLKRFDIITTYYPFSSEDYDLPYVKGSKLKDTAYYKIKRVIALPGDTFKIENNELYFKNEGRWLAPVNFDSYGIKRLLGIDGDYGNYPRGRVIFDNFHRKFIVYLDKALDKKEIKESIKLTYCLEEERTVFKRDAHYTHDFL